MEKQKVKLIRVHGCYSALNSDLGIKDRTGKLMNGEHDVFVMGKVNKYGYVKVKTITSLENIKQNGTRTFHEGALEDVRNGIIIPIPLEQMNSLKLSGINRKPIWIHKSKLHKSNNQYKYPSDYNSLISKDYK